jgi:hypothetical protein
MFVREFISDVGGFPNEFGSSQRGTFCEINARREVSGEAPPRTDTVREQARCEKYRPEAVAIILATSICAAVAATAKEVGVGVGHRDLDRARSYCSFLTNNG